MRPPAAVKICHLQVLKAAIMLVAPRCWIKSCSHSRRNPVGVLAENAWENQEGNPGLDLQNIYLMTAPTYPPPTTAPNATRTACLLPALFKVLLPLISWPGLYLMLCHDVGERRGQLAEHRLRPRLSCHGRFAPTPVHKYVNGCPLGLWF